MDAAIENVKQRENFLYWNLNSTISLCGEGLTNGLHGIKN